MRILVYLRHKLQDRAGTTVAVRTLGDIGNAAGGSGCRSAVEAALVLMELGICTVYFEFISTNVAAVVGDSSVKQRQIIMAMLIPVLGGLALIRNMKTLAPLSGIANGAMATGLAVIVYFSVYHMVRVIYL